MQYINFISISATDVALVNLLYNKGNYKALDWG